MNDVDVAIVGAGPTGLALAGELRLAGVTCRVLERRTNESNLTRAFAVHARTLELLDARGLADRLVERGVQVPSVTPTPGATLDLGSKTPAVTLVRPDGYVAWASDRPDDGRVRAALREWCGPVPVPTS